MNYSLLPFNGAASDVSIEVAIERHANVLALAYTLAGNLADVAIPAPAIAPTRRDGLWEHTCFECFVAPQDSRQYWEWNLAPSGEWNVYHWDDYRQGSLRPELAFAKLPFAVRRDSALTLAIEIALDKIMPARQPIQLAASAVVERNDGALAYWALAHRGPAPDFHLRASFIVAL